MAGQRVRLQPGDVPLEPDAGLRIPVQASGLPCNAAAAPQGEDGDPAAGRWCGAPLPRKRRRGAAGGGFAAWEVGGDAGLQGAALVACCAELDAEEVAACQAKGRSGEGKYKAGCLTTRLTVAMATLYFSCHKPLARSWARAECRCECIRVPF